MAIGLVPKALKCKPQAAPPIELVVTLYYRVLVSANLTFYCLDGVEIDRLDLC